MTTVVKLSQRVPNRSILNKLCYYSNRSLTTFSKLHQFRFYPSSSISRLTNNNHICSNICGCLLRQKTSNYSMSTTQDKDNEDENDKNDKEQESDETTEEEMESDEGESDGEQNQQMIDLQNKVEELQSELKKYQDALARSHADIINIQNMSKKDVEAAKKFATKNFSRDMLNVADSLQSCIAVVEQHLDDVKNINATTDENIKSVIDGVKVTHNTLLDTFGRHGISKIESLYKEFDPNYHEALFRMPSDDHPPDHVVQVISEGYTIKDTVLRAAKVGVSTPTPTPTPTPKQNETEGGNNNESESTGDEDKNDDK